MSAEGIRKTCVMSNDDVFSESDEPSSRFYLIGTGVRTDGSRVIGMVIKSRKSSAGGSALDVVVVVTLDPRHELPQIATHRLDRVLLRRFPERLELRRAGILVVDEAGSE